MQAVIITVVVLGALFGVVNPVHAQKIDACKECRDFQRACAKAHSQTACKTDYDICIKHCQQK